MSEVEEYRKRLRPSFDPKAPLNKARPHTPPSDWADRVALFRTQLAEVRASINRLISDPAARGERTGSDMLDFIVQLPRHLSGAIPAAAKKFAP